MTQQLIEMYTQVVTASGLTVKDDGSVYKGEDRYFIKGKPLMLPLPAVINRADAGEKIIFHPLAEAAAKGESDVLEDLRNRFALKLNVATAKLIGFFLQLGVGTVKVRLDPEQIKVMSVVKNVDEKIVRDILDVIKASARGDGKRTPLIKLYLSRRPQVVGTVKYYRTGIVSFPLYQAALEELSTKEKGYELLGVKINKKGLESFCRLMEFIYPGIDKDQEAYNQGSTSQIAPFADAMIRAVGGLISMFNEKVDLYKDVSEVEALRLPTRWIDICDMMDELFQQIQSIPLQPNADGKARVSDVQTADLVVRPVAGQPVHTGQHANSSATDVHVTPAPTMMQQQRPVQTMPAQQAVESEFIRENGVLRRNPNFLRPAMVGGMPGMGNPLDPYSSNVLLPQNTTVLPPANLHNMNFSPVSSPYGNGTSQQASGSRLPGLSY